MSHYLSYLYILTYEHLFSSYFLTLMLIRYKLILYMTLMTTLMTLMTIVTICPISLHWWDIHRPQVRKLQWVPRFLFEDILNDLWTKSLLEMKIKCKPRNLFNQRGLWLKPLIHHNSRQISDYKLFSGALCWLALSFHSIGLQIHQEMNNVRNFYRNINETLGSFMKTHEVPDWIELFIQESILKPWK